MFLEGLDDVVIEFGEAVVDISQEHLLLEPIGTGLGDNFRDASCIARPTVEHKLDAAV